MKSSSRNFERSSTNTKMTVLLSPFAMLLWMGCCLFLLASSPCMIAIAEASAPVLGDLDNVQATESSSIGSDDSKPKNADTDAAAARFVHKTIIIPHDEKKFRGGEDAASTMDTMLVVADGVGGWANRGVNPGLYSRKLTETITSKFSKLSQEKQATVDLKKLVHESNHIAADAHLGSATCTVVRLKDATTLETVNVGDSGYSIHRRRKNTNIAADKDDEEDPLEVVYASIPGQKGFNFPYQLGGQYGDQVDEPNVTDGPNTHTLQDKDVIVVVSDGIIDNIDPHEYHACIAEYLWNDNDDDNDNTSLSNKAAFEARYKGYFDHNELVSYSVVADCIAKKAYFLGKDPNYMGPFARSAANYGKRYVGGKHDDITVVVAQVELGDSVVDGSRDDPYKSESIFVYTNEDGPIQKHDFLPTRDEILGLLLSRTGTKTEDDPVANEL